MAALPTLSASALLMSASAAPATLIADRPLAVPGTSLLLSIAAFHWGLPFLLALGHRLLLGQEAISPPIRGLLSLLATAAVGSVWLADLVRHDRFLSLFHGIMIVSMLLPASFRPPRKRGWVGAIAGGCLLAVVTYGAVWGETRCDESSAVRCLADGGPRIWVPVILERLGVPVFADLQGADLSGLSLRGRDLRYADLSESDLDGADLSDANLRRATLDDVRAADSTWRAAYLDGATMARADLRRADLREIHAYRLDLSGADLRGADLENASLSHADLSGTRLGGSRMSGTYLRFSEGLTPARLGRACGDRRTLLPAGLSLPPCGGP